MSLPSPSCDPADVVRIQQAIARNPNDLGVGIVDTTTGEIRLFAYDETNAFSLANQTLSAMAGHDAAATMAGIDRRNARGFVLGKIGADWHVYNQSHLNHVDGQTNSMRMSAATFDDVVSALVAAGVSRPTRH